MALSFFFPSTFSRFSFPHLRPITSTGPKSTKTRNSYVSQSLKCTTKASLQVDHANAIDHVARRSGNYTPTIWDFDYLQSLDNKYRGENYIERVNEGKDKVRVMLEKERNPIEQLELIDMLQRLGISYHFEKEISHLIKCFYMNLSNPYNVAWKENNLYATALEFRLLRQHGYFVNQDVFDPFKEERGGFKASLSDDTMGLLSLYEASFFLLKDESVLEEARVFTMKHLEEYIECNQQSQDYASMLVSHALELPLHWRVPRVEALWFIASFEKKSNMNHTLLEFAKLDFNVVQSIHQEDLKHASRWWNQTGVREKLRFVRDRVVESFIWTMGMSMEPQLSYCRIMGTKVNALIVVLDDTYDIYGTIDELEIFTKAIQSWDISAIDHLPDYMKLGFFNVFNAVNEMAFEVFKEQGIFIIEYLKKMWQDLSKAYLVEAKWYDSGYKPSLEEYIENAWISVGTNVMLIHAYILTTNPISKEALDFFVTYPSLIRQSAILLRLADDQGTSADEMKRGDVPKSIQCCMHDRGVSEEEARQHIKSLIREEWKQMNEDRLITNNLLFPRAFIEAATDLARVAFCLYLYEDDGHGGIQEGEAKNRVLALLVDPLL